MTDQACQSSLYSGEFRQRLRREKIAAREAMPTEEHARRSGLILGHLAKTLAALPPGVIAYCAPIRAEVDCQPLVLQLLDAGWQAAMPVVTAPDGPMDFRPWTPKTPMTADRYGIPIPDSSLTTTPTVVLLPLVAFDAAGYRLGYGGGYFDRTLAGMQPQPRAIGVGFEAGAIESIGPAGHDVRLDAIATEAGIRRFDVSGRTP